MLETTSKALFSVSTDKAANPVNIMEPKSLMEKLILSKQNAFRVSTARFANVAFSNGSLLDGFLYRLNKNNPYPVLQILSGSLLPQNSRVNMSLATFLGKSGNIFFPKLDLIKIKFISKILH